MFTTKGWSRETLFSDMLSACSLKLSYSKENWMRWKKYLLSEARGIMMGLYDQNILTHPCQLNTNDVVRFLLDNGFDVFNKFGQMDLSLENLKLVLYVAKKKGTASKDACRNLKRILEAYELLERIQHIDIIYSNTKSINNAKKTANIKVTLLVSGGEIKNTCKIPATVDLLYSQKEIVPEETHFKVVSINSAYRKAILRKAGVGSERFKEGGFFIDGLSATQEVELLNHILSGKVELTGELKKNLVVQQLDGSLNLVKSLQNLDFSLLMEEVASFFQRHLVGTNGSKDNEEFAIIEGGIAIKRSRKRMKVTYPLYSVVINEDESVSLLEKELLEKRGSGVTGEFIDKDRYERELEVVRYYSESLLTTDNKFFGFLNERVIEQPLPILVEQTGARGSIKEIEVYDIFQTNLWLNFNEVLGNEIQISLGEPVYEEKETWGKDVVSQLKLARNRFEKNGVSNAYIRKSVLSGLSGLEKGMLCLQQQD